MKIQAAKMMEAVGPIALKRSGRVNCIISLSAFDSSGCEHRSQEPNAKPRTLCHAELQAIASTRDIGRGTRNEDRKGRDPPGLKVATTMPPLKRDADELSSLNTAHY